MSYCKNCEVYPEKIEGLCEHCYENYELTCKNQFCDNKVKDEKTVCYECKQVVRELQSMLEKEENKMGD